MEFGFAIDIHIFQPVIVSHEWICSRVNKLIVRAVGAAGWNQTFNQGWIQFFSILKRAVCRAIDIEAEIIGFKADERQRLRLQSSSASSGNHAQNAGTVAPTADLGSSS